MACLGMKAPRPMDQSGYVFRPHTVPSVQILTINCELHCLMCWAVDFQELSCPLGNVLLCVSTGHENIVSHTSLYNNEVKEKKKNKYL